MPRRLCNLLAAHIGDLVHLLAELGRIGVQRRQFRDEALDPLVELALLALLDGHQTRRLLRRHRRHRLGGVRFSASAVIVSVGAVVAIIVSLPVLY